MVERKTSNLKNGWKEKKRKDGWRVKERKDNLKYSWKKKDKEDQDYWRNLNLLRWTYFYPQNIRSVVPNMPFLYPTDHEVGPEKNKIRETSRIGI